MNSELDQLHDALIDIIGVAPNYFRPPEGAIDDRVTNILQQKGYTKIILVRPKMISFIICFF